MHVLVLKCQIYAVPFPRMLDFSTASTTNCLHSQTCMFVFKADSAEFTLLAFSNCLHSQTCMFVFKAGSAEFTLKFLLISRPDVQFSFTLRLAQFSG